MRFINIDSIIQQGTNLEIAIRYLNQIGVRYGLFKRSGVPENA